MESGIFASLPADILELLVLLVLLVPLVLLLILLLLLLILILLLLLLLLPLLIFFVDLSLVIFDCRMKSHLYIFSHKITQQSTKLKGCGRFLLRWFVSGRVGVMFVCGVLFVCLLDSI